MRFDRKSKNRFAKKEGSKVVGFCFVLRCVFTDSPCGLVPKPKNFGVVQEKKRKLVSSASNSTRSKRSKLCCFVEAFPYFRHNLVVRQLTQHFISNT